ncbi:MAG: UvrD-helicase domain-containing protein [Eubacteriales bacterium]
MLVITFTKAAAREMKERYLRLTNSAIRRFLSARFMRSFSRF